MNAEITEANKTCEATHCYHKTFDGGKYCFSHAAELLNAHPLALTKREVEIIRLCVKVQLIFPRF